MTPHSHKGYSPYFYLEGCNMWLFLAGCFVGACIGITIIALLNSGRD